jgi:methyltransferase family protein
MFETPRTPHSIRAYSRTGLGFYDPLIMGLVVGQVWGCASHRLVDHYREHLTANHADVGVGTGYCLDRCGYREPARLALIDLQPNCLAHTAQRLERFHPQVYLRNVLYPVRGLGEPFDSIALGGVLHCLAGDLTRKSVVFDNLAALMHPGTRIFGYTLVRDGVPARRRRRLLAGLLNRLRYIDNRADRVDDLRAALESRFVNSRIDLIGCMALFSAEARKPS